MSTTLAELLLAAWPAEHWRDVHVVVAVSGGADSTALATALAAAKPETGGPGALSLAHVNHQLRGEESERQERWVEQLAARLNLPLTCRRLPAFDRAARDGDGIEAAARADRYAALTSIAEALGARFVAVAHTQDDQAETVLMRIMRGAGLRGLGGIRRVRPLSPCVSLVRPLLTLPRRALEVGLAQCGATWFHDSSNDDRRFHRNCVRHDFLPALRAAVPGVDVDEVFASLADAAQEYGAALERHADRLLACCQIANLQRRPQEGDASAEPSAFAGSGTAGASPSRMLLMFDAKRLSLAAPELRAEALRVAWRRSGWPEQGMTRRHWRQLALLADSPSGTALNLPDDLRATIGDGMLAIASLPAPRRVPCRLP